MIFYTFLALENINITAAPTNGKNNIVVIREDIKYLEKKEEKKSSSILIIPTIIMYKKVFFSRIQLTLFYVFI